MTNTFLELLLVRHGETPWNVERRVMGMRPIGLTPNGQVQLTQIARALAPVALDAVYTSPAQRTRESADILLAHREAPTTLIEHDAFAEVDYGDWIGHPFTAFEGTTAFFDYLLRPSTFQVPGGERLTDMQRRAVAGVESIATRHTPGRVAVVTHADIVKAIVVHYVGAPLDHWHRYWVVNGSVTILRIANGRGRLVGMNLCPVWDRLFRPDATAPKNA